MYEEARHEPLIAAEWDEELARAAIERMVHDTHEQFDPEKLWPIHPLDRFGADLSESFKMLYFGAAGVIWALHYLKRVGATAIERNYAITLDRLAEANRKEMKLSTREAASFLMGDVGILLVRWQLSPAEEIRQELFNLIKANIHNPTRELMWGAPGTMLVALSMFEGTGESLWKDLFLQSAEELWKNWEEIPGAQCYLWTQDLYGRSLRYIGAGHGFAANASVLIRGHRLLDAVKQKELFPRIAQTFVATAEEDGECANWPAVWLPSTQGGKMLVQHCHGAPGMITCLADFPVGTNPKFDQLLEKGGELTWKAGPLTKGPSLCHGTAGNGYGFLKLYRRTSKRKWLDRARAFAMHSIEQSERMAKEYGQRRYSLWTGDLGLAVYLLDCIREETRFPTMDVF
jgi:Lanthionine synthetase C-like protein